MTTSDGYFEETRAIFRKLQEDPPPELEDLAEAILDGWKHGGKVVSFGNGGSATDSMHFTTELVARFDDDPIHQPAISLASSPATLTAVANDWSFEDVFARQVRAQVQANDVVLGISTSGDSPNVVNGLEAACDLDARVFGLTGETDCHFDDLSITKISVPARRTSHVQEAHIACLHYVCEIIDQTINK